LILKLPYLETKDQFDENYKFLEEFFSSNDPESKSFKYLKEIWNYKEKWANSYRKIMFTAGTNTTSRAESMNKYIKEYLHKNTELSSLIELINQLDISSAFENPLKNLSKSKKCQNEGDPLIVNIKEELGEIIFKKHYREFLESPFYSATVIQSEPDQEIDSMEIPRFKVTRDQLNEDESEINGRITSLIEKPPIARCSCNTYLQEGIICRHIFALAKIGQIKDLSNYLHPRWKIKAFEQQQVHNFSQEEIKSIKSEEESKREKEEDEAEQKLVFESLVASSKKKKVVVKKKKIDGDESEDCVGDIEVIVDSNESPIIKNFQKAVTKGRKETQGGKKKKADEKKDFQESRELKRLKKLQGNKEK